MNFIGKLIEHNVDLLCVVNMLIVASSFRISSYRARIEETFHVN